MLLRIWQQQQQQLRKHSETRNERLFCVCCVPAISNQWWECFLTLFAWNWLMILFDVLTRRRGEKWRHKMVRHCEYSYEYSSTSWFVFSSTLRSKFQSALVYEVLNECIPYSIGGQRCCCFWCFFLFDWPSGKRRRKTWLRRAYDY